AALFAHDHTFVWLLDDRATTLHALTAQPLDILDAAGLTDPAIVACAAISAVSAVVATVSLAAIRLRIALLGGPSVLALIAAIPSTLVAIATVSLAATRLRIALLGGPSVLALIARAAISPIPAVIPTITTRL